MEANEAGIERVHVQAKWRHEAPTTHNWNGEIEQLGAYGRVLIERSRG